MPKRSRGSTVFTIGMDVGVLRAIYLNWVVAGNLPFTLAELSSFRAFLEFVNSTANLLLSRSHHTIRQNFTIAVRLRRPTIQQALRDIRSKIYLIFDGWISFNGYGLLGV